MQGFVRLNRRSHLLFVPSHVPPSPSPAKRARVSSLAGPSCIPTLPRNGAAAAQDVHNSLPSLQTRVCPARLPCPVAAGPGTTLEAPLLSKFEGVLLQGRWRMLLCTPMASHACVRLLTLAHTSFRLSIETRSAHDPWTSNRRELFSKAVATPATRATFIANIFAFLAVWKFDG